MKRAPKRPRNGAPHIYHDRWVDKGDFEVSSREVRVAKGQRLPVETKRASHILPLAGPQPMEWIEDFDIGLDSQAWEDVDVEHEQPEPEHSPPLSQKKRTKRSNVSVSLRYSLHDFFS
jgi:hypothetical protein